MTSASLLNYRTLGPIAQPMGWARQQAQASQAQRLANMGQNARQMELGRLWAWYACHQYADRSISWDGTRVPMDEERDLIARQGYLPPGFATNQAQVLPPQFRRPTAPAHLAKAIVDRFTGSLFGEHACPQVKVPGDPKTEDYVQGLIDATRLWAKLILARTYGGAEGTACLSFLFKDGHPRLEVHDPRWLFPTWRDAEDFELEALEKRYTYQEERRDPTTGEWVKVWLWYRRVIDAQCDTLYAPAPFGDGAEPIWQVQSKVEHGFGFVPAVWIQNLPGLDDIDGVPDCQGAYDMMEAMDRLLSQADKATLANADPTLNVITDAELADVRTGSDGALKLPGGSSAGYIEHTGSGATAARQMAADYRKQILELVSCVLESESSIAKTATEVERAYATMINKVGMLREQYGQLGIARLISKMLRAAAQLARPTVPPGGGQPIIQAVLLPPRMEEQEDGTELPFPRELGPSAADPHVTLAWPPHFAPTPESTTSAVTSAVAAVTGRILDQESAVRYVAPFFGEERPKAILRRLKAEEASRQGPIDASALGLPPGPRFEDLIPPKRITPGEDALTPGDVRAGGKEPQAPHEDAPAPAAK